MKPASVDVASFPEVDQLLTTQVDLLKGKRLSKGVWLDGQNETKELDMDSLSWVKELSFLKEINPNQSEYIGSFDEEMIGNSTMLSLKEGENGTLQTFELNVAEDSNVAIKASIYEDKDVFVHHRKISVNFSNGVISTFEVEGFQKILFKDSIRFKITGTILSPD